MEKKEKKMLREASLIRYQRASLRIILIFAVVCLLACPGVAETQTWVMEYSGSYYLPTDIINDYCYHKYPGIGLIVDSLAGAIYRIEYLYEEHIEEPAPEKTPLAKGKIKEALQATFNSEYVDNDLLSLASLGEAKYIRWSVWHLGQYSGEGNIFWGSFIVDGIKVMLMGAIDDGLVEAIAIADYNTIEDFEEDARRIFNIPESVHAVYDYRPVRFNLTSVGFKVPDIACDYDYSGYKMSLTEPGREWLCRSVERKYSREDGNPPIELLKTIEFSVVYKAVQALPADDD